MAGLRRLLVPLSFLYISRVPEHEHGTLYIASDVRVWLGLGPSFMNESINRSTMWTMCGSITNCLLLSFYFFSSSISLDHIISSLEQVSGFLFLFLFFTFLVMIMTGAACLFFPLFQ